MAYGVILTPRVARQLDRLRGIPRVAMRGVLSGLANDPKPRGAARLAGKRNLWRLNIQVDGSHWRVIYVIDDERREVTVTLVLARNQGSHRAP